MTPCDTVFCQKVVLSTGPRTLRTLRTLRTTETEESSITITIALFLTITVLLDHVTVAALTNRRSLSDITERQQLF